jgi:ADP-ribosyl-[dinitrogen reductase] hydrolase
MLGTIIGDIIGSPYEHNNVKHRNIDLFTPCSHITDDTVMTIAVAHGLMRGDLIKSMDYYGNKYSYAGYGKRFKEWLQSTNKNPYGSYGNGAAMRISSIPYIFPDIDTCIRVCDQVTNLTHNCDQSIVGARAIVHAIHLALRKARKQDIRYTLESTYGYNLRFTLDSIRDNYKFDVSCAGSVPQAIVSFLESNSYEDCVRNAISIGGDSDTIAAMAGGIAEAFYEYIDMYTLKMCLPLIPDEFFPIIKQLSDYYLKYVKPNRAISIVV